MSLKKSATTTVPPPRLLANTTHLTLFGALLHKKGLSVFRLMALELPPWSAGSIEHRHFDPLQRVVRMLDAAIGRVHSIRPYSCLPTRQHHFLPPHTIEQIRNTSPDRYRDGANSCPHRVPRAAVRARDTTAAEIFISIEERHQAPTLF